MPTIIFDVAMLKQVIAILLLLLHSVTFAFVSMSGDQDCYAVMEKKVDQAGAGELDYYLYSSCISLRLPDTSAEKGDGRLYKEDRYSHLSVNIYSPPPECTNA